MRPLMHTLSIGLLFALAGPTFAAPATKDEAMTMVKGAIASIKKDGPDTAYTEISNKSGKFVDSDLYVVVYGLDSHVLAHGANSALIGTDQSAAKDADGNLS
jgi:cytochrome c